MAKGHKDKVAVITGGATGIGQAVGECDELIIDRHADFQKDTTKPPVTISAPPARIGSVGSSRKNTKVMICHITKSVAI